MNYGWATVFTLAAWFAGLVIDVNVRVGDLGLRTVLPVIVMGCCIMKFIKDNNIQRSIFITSLAGNLKTVARSFYTLKSEKGGTLCQAKPKNISPLPSARQMA